MPGKIILGIPGRWQNRKDLITAIVQANPDPKNVRYLALGPLISDLQTKEAFGFEVCDHDPRLADAFRIAGQGRFSTELLASIAQHTLTLYIHSRDQSVEAARSMLSLGAFLLAAGGMAVKVETAGVAHTADRWRYFARTSNLLSLHDAFVTLVGGKEFNYTCGMHNVGLPDASLTAQISVKDAPEYLVAFNQWNLIERPQLKDGDRFAVSLSDPVFTLGHLAYGYDSDNEYNNPHGRWHLELADAKPAGQGVWKERSEPLFMGFRNDDPEMRECVKKAQATLSHFLARFESRHEFGTFMVKIRIEEGAEHAFLWLGLQHVQNNGLSAIVFEAPPEFPSLSKGTTVAVAREKVLDWAQVRHGVLVGGFSLRLQRSRLSEENRKHFDLYSGFVAYSPVEEIPEGSI
jgi:uncharacterized protein YegJ (DUF2314 family)